MELYFGNSSGPRQEIANCETMQEVNIAIRKYIKENFPENFTSYYTRVWQQEGGMWVFDIGSWSKFFYWDAPNFSYESMKEVDERV